MASKILHLPDYCNSFKDLLVEELIFHKSPYEFHYGKCSTVGKLGRRGNLCYLQNISLGCLDKSYCMRTGVVEILLLQTCYRSNPDDLSSFHHLVNGSFYEVHGETAFLNAHEPNSAPITVSEMIINQRKNNLKFTESIGRFDLSTISDSIFELNETAIKHDIEHFARTYIPVLQVHTINEIDQAEELIQCNLQIRTFRNKRHINHI